MAQAQQKQFRIEKSILTDNVDLDENDLAAYRHREVMDAISRVEGDTQADGQISQELLAQYRTEHAEAQKLKSELSEIYQAIENTKTEIASLHHNSFSNDSSVVVSNELDAVVKHTEQATDMILSSAETIDAHASDLIGLLKREGNVNLATDIQENVLKIFEACNFQDVTGQRITKVVTTLKFIEERIDGIMDIWGGTEGFDHIVSKSIKPANGDDALLNGPSMEDDPTSASQDDIDALFD